MRKLLLFCILASLSAIPAKSNISFALYPEEKTYVISVAQQSQQKAWDGQLTFVFPDNLTVLLPSRFMIGVGDASLSLGYGGFWQGYALLPFFCREQALLYQGGKDAVMVLSGAGRRRAVGYERSTSRASLSALAWMAPVQGLSSFLSKWGSVHARWGVATKLLVKTSAFGLDAEALFTPVKGLEGFVSSSFRYAGCTLLFAYGEAPYPSRYSFALDLQSKLINATFVMEECFGPEPIYGGHSAIRKRVQRGSVKLSLATGYLLVSLSDTFEFKRKGLALGSVVLQARWVAPFGQVSVYCKESRGLSKALQREYRFTLSLHKATISYTKEGYEIALTDSLPLGRGVGTVTLKKRMGRALTLSLLYTLTSDR